MSRPRPNKKPHIVRTAAGAKKYGVPIGSAIGASKSCKHPKCKFKKFSGGFCKMHYTRNRNGSPPMDAPRRKLKGEAIWSDWRVNKGGYLVRQLQYRSGGKQKKLYQLQHRYVWEEAHGPLLPGQNIHHINGVRDDNRLENLELWDTAQPKGQRAKDKLAWAKEMFDRYAAPGESWNK